MTKKTEFVTYRRWENYAKRIERANIKREGHSITFTGICRRANHHIIEIQSDNKGMIVSDGWQESMKINPGVR